MTHTALVAIAPIFTLERFDDPRWRSDRTLYEGGALRFLPGKDTVPLIVNHDDEWEIGTVHELFRMEWVDGPWTVARCTVDTPPAWLKRNTRASFGFKVIHRRELSIREAMADVVAGALVTEVSVLSEMVEPAEPCASVWSFRRIETPVAVSTSDRAVVGGPVMTGRVVRRGSGEIVRVR